MKTGVFDLDASVNCALSQSTFFHAYKKDREQYATLRKLFSSLWGAMDSNSDGKVTIDEFAAYVRDLSPAEREENCVDDLEDFLRELYGRPILSFDFWDWAKFFFSCRPSNDITSFEVERPAWAP